MQTPYRKVQTEIQIQNCEADMLALCITLQQDYLTVLISFACLCIKWTMGRCGHGQMCVISVNSVSVCSPTISRVLERRGELLGSDSGHATLLLSFLGRSNSSLCFTLCMSSPDKQKKKCQSIQTWDSAAMFLQCVDNDENRILSVKHKSIL